LAQLVSQLLARIGGLLNLQRELDAFLAASDDQALSISAPEAPSFREMAEAAVDAFASGPRGPILHAPIDDGRAMGFLADQVAFLIGVSPDPDLMQLAGERGRRRGLSNFVLQAGNISSLPFADGSFSGVFCAGHLGHLRNPDRALKEMLRVCAPGGHVIADFIAPQDCTRQCPGMQPSTDGGYLHPDGKTFYRYLDKWKLEEILGQAGASKFQVKIEEKSWRDGGNLEAHDVLALRHSWVVLIRRNRL
jgi:SAM-dependent methyltransferase